jgi:hypothetical protein
MWIKRKPRIHRGPRFAQLSEPREGREVEMRSGIVPICVEPPAHPDDRFGIGTELRLGKADPTPISESDVRLVCGMSAVMPLEDRRCQPNR